MPDILKNIMIGGIIGLILIIGGISWNKWRKPRTYPFMGQPIEALNFWMGYYMDEHHNKEELLGTIPLTDTVFVLDTYLEKETKERLQIEKIANLQLTFAFRHHVKEAKSTTDPWRVANQGGLLLGNEIPIELIGMENGQSFGKFKATSTRTHNFEFHLGLEEFVSLPKGKYEMIIYTAKADIPSGKRELVKQLFSPKYYPSYRIKIIIP